MTYGTRVLRVNLKAIVGMMRWNFPKGTKVHIQDHKLPDDAAFVGIVKVEDPYIYIRLASQTWLGDSDNEIIPPQFKYEGADGTLALPNVEEILRRGH